MRIITIIVVISILQIKAKSIHIYKDTQEERAHDSSSWLKSHKS